MKMQVFAVYDSKAEVFGLPLFFTAKGLAVRAFDEQCNNPESQMYKHPGDFTLFHLGEYDQDTGLMVSLPTPTSLGTGVEYKRQSELPIQ